MRSALKVTCRPDFSWPALRASMRPAMTATLRKVRRSMEDSAIHSSRSSPSMSSAKRASMSRSEEHTSELQSLMRISYAVFCLKKKKKITNNNILTSITSINPTYTEHLDKDTILETYH